MTDMKRKNRKNKLQLNSKQILNISDQKKVK